MRILSRSRREFITHIVFAVCAAIGVLLMAMIVIFIGSRAFATFTVDHVSPRDFFFNAAWDPQNGTVGSLVLIVGSVTATLVAVLISAPVSVGAAIFISEIAPRWARSVMQPVLELFLGIPSIVYGLLGLVILVPLIAHIYNAIAGGFFYAGFGVLAAAIVLAIMILPTITTISVDAIRSLPGGLREASAALGATRWQTIRKTLLPAASSGIYTGIILGVGRAIGETLAVSYVIGSNATRFPLSVDNVYPYFHLLPTSTVTVQLFLDFFEVEPNTLNYDALWTLAFVLLIITVLLVLASRWVASRSAFNVQAQKPTGRTSLWRRLAVATSTMRSTGR